VTDEPPPVIWARLSGQGRGPVRTLDYRAITKAAIALADEDGVARSRRGWTTARCRSTGTSAARMT
jgi:hypothetical protein